MLNHFLKKKYKQITALNLWSFFYLVQNKINKDLNWCSMRAFL